MLDRPARNPTLRLWLPVVGIAVILVADAALSAEGPPVDATGVAAAFAGCLPIVLRDRVPLLAMIGLITAGIVLILWRLEPTATITLLPAYALFELARTASRANVLVTAGLVPVAVIVSVLPFAGGEAASIIIGNVALCELALAVGALERRSREEADRGVAAAQVEAQARLGEERLRIAREVHDVVAHSIVAINVQAGVAAHLLEDDTAQAREALRQIKRTSGEALTDLRATLGVLRDTDRPAPTGPAGGLRDLAGLAAQLRAAGVAVELDVGELHDVPAPVHAAGYRIVQEALTNVLRHARARTAAVSVCNADGVLHVAVVDDGAGAGATANGGGAGSGVRGMRERARALGGTLQAGPRDGGGWQVRATLPLAGTPA